MRVLIVGATGFVGAHQRRECERRGDEITGTYRPGEEIPSDGRWCAVDLLERKTVRSALEDAAPEGIVHLAGQANVALANRDPRETFRINAEGTLIVLDEARRVCPDARVVAINSAEVYGAVPAEELPVTEDRPLAPRSAYGVSKAAADLVAAQAAHGWGLAVMRMRPFNHVGPGQRLGFVAPDFASQVAAIERGDSDPVLKVGNLSGRRDFTDVRDIVRGYREALERGTAGRAYNLCSGRSVAIEDIVRFFVAQARVEIEIRRDDARFRPIDVPEFLGDASRARREFGWEPEIPLETSLGEVLDEWRARAPHKVHPVD